jgi:hypothetical protein
MATQLAAVAEGGISGSRSSMEVGVVGSANVWEVLWDYSQLFTCKFWQVDASHCW